MVAEAHASRVILSDLLEVCGASVCQDESSSLAQVSTRDTLIWHGRACRFDPCFRTTPFDSESTPSGDIRVRCVRETAKRNLETQESCVPRDCDGLSSGPCAAVGQSSSSAHRPSRHALTPESIAVQWEYTAVPRLSW